MNIITHKQISTKDKIAIVLLYRRNNSIKFITTRYKISKATLMRWNKLYDGSEESLENKSRKPLSHPNAHSQEEINNIINLIKRNPTIGLTELYSKLRHKYNYKRHYASLYRLLVKLNYYNKKKLKYKKYTPQKYDTPEFLGEKWQLDVKFVPIECNANKQDDYKYYQYTVIDEASRERFIYAYKEHSSDSTVDFIKRAIVFFGYIPKIIQTDNGSEFTYTRETKNDISHPMDILCQELNIQHKLLRPRTPRHNGKVERSHRNDQERFYNHLKFYSFEDLHKQMARYLKRSNNIGITTLNYLTPNEKRKELLKQGKIYINQ